ncbi:hypothetical protein BKP35_04725 [Anaerobacillus arseniciselenatis]|uniref:DUF1129 domain-containing protein n=1 Tax=Anaerobacillus arseniciselenatis TaxID=85682 RepID=A0A1S2LRK9_9BACI|nr:DUF1129 family protein [Anaerobacillus arseniciselenatis]OIJ15159.1 hypothetical protein BKP35_04725 [Anaerobacillus arseniciselenatis]
MNIHELVELNNQKRKLLTEENRKYYEKMLVYIRLSYRISDLETEETLSELLDHLLDAQEEGKNAEEVFGKNPKKYADEIIGELPKMVTKERTSLIGMGILFFLAVSMILSGIIALVSHYYFTEAGLMKEFYLGSALLKTAISIPVAFFLLYSIIFYLRWSCFKKINKIAEFFVFWFYGAFSVGLFVIIYLFIPSFGPKLEISVFIVIMSGVILFILGTLFKRKIEKGKR